MDMNELDDRLILALVTLTIIGIAIGPLICLRNPKSTRTVQSKALTFRISNIPRSVTDDRIRECFKGFRSQFSKVSSPQNENRMLGWSLAPAAAATISGDYWVATITFRYPPAPKELEATFKREVGGDNRWLRVDLDFFGLTPLADPREDTIVDIIAVSSGHAFGSWKSKDNAAMWLRDFLPKTIRNSRILTYGYDTKLAGSQSSKSIQDLSKNLLESIKTTRCGKTRDRPLILIGHSLGGLVVKEALALAAEGGPSERDILLACYAVVFFGVPNRGLDTSGLRSIVEGQPNEDLVRNLDPSSPYLSLLQDRFYRNFTLNNSKIISIYETQTTPTVEWSPKKGSWERTGPRVLMVPRTSATHTGRDEELHNQLPIDANHTDIVKFSDPSNPDYSTVESRIRELVLHAPKVIRRRFSDHRKKLSDDERTYAKALKAPDSATVRQYRVDDPAPDTLQWFLEEEPVCNWRSKDQNAILWVEGSPAQGKTVLSKFLLETLEASQFDCQKQSKVIYFFFYEQDEGFRTVSSALRSLIKQLLDTVGVFEYISDRFDLAVSTESEYGLWQVLEEILCAPIFDMVYCVLDALDECSDYGGSRYRLLKRIKDFVSGATTNRNGPVLKFFFTSRQKFDINRDLTGFPCIRLKTDPQELKTFIQESVDPLGLDTTLREAAIELLSNEAERTYFWASTVLNKLRLLTPVLSRSELERIVEESPKDLTRLNRSLLDKSEKPPGRKVLAWAANGQQRLTLKELERDLAMQSTSTNLSTVGL